MIFPPSSQTHPCPRHGAIVYEGERLFFLSPPRLTLVPGAGMVLLCMKGEVIFPLSSQTHPCPRHGAIVYEGERLFFLSPPRLTLVPGAGMVLLCMKGEVIFPLSSQTHPCPRSRHGAIVYEGERLFFLSPPRLTLVPGAGMVLLCMKGEVIFPLSSQTQPCPRGRHGAIVYEGERLFFLSPPRLTLVPGMVLLCMKRRGYFSSLLPDSPLSQAWCYCV